MSKLKDRQRATTLLVLGLFATIFVLINAQQLLFGALVYIVLGIITLFLYSQWSNIGRESKESIGIDDNFYQDALVGFGLGVATIVLSFISPLIGTLGIPNVQSIAGTIGRFIIIVISAPIFEEIFFRGFILDFFDEKFTNLPFIVANLITATLFSLYHILAYGENLSAVSGSFLTAGLMGFIFGYVRLKQKSVIGSITYHSTMNLYIGFVSLAIII